MSGNTAWRSKSMADRFDIYHSARLESKALEDIWQRAYGKDYATDAKPNGFYSLPVLERIIATGSEISGRTLLDIGCGYGWTSFFLARRMNMKLLGTDVSPVGIELAKKEATKRDVAAQFWVADAAFTEFEDGACAIATCLDVLLYLVDKAGFLKEMHRILEPGGLFIFTTWEQHGYSQRLGAQQTKRLSSPSERGRVRCAVHLPAKEVHLELASAVRGLHQRALEVRSDVGELPASMFAGMARSAREESDGRTYIFGIAQRR